MKNLEYDDHGNRIHWIDNRGIEWKSVYDYSKETIDVCIYWTKFPANLLKTMPEGGIREWEIKFNG